MSTPVIIFAFAYSLGIIFGRYSSFPTYLLAVAAAAFMLSSLVMAHRKPVLMLIAPIFIAGIISYQFSILIPANDISVFADDKFLSITGYVIDEPVIKDDLCRFTLKTISIKSRGSEHLVTGNATIMVKGGTMAIDYGDKLIVRGKLSSICSTSNPGIASFADLMAKRGERCQLFASSGGIRLLGHGTGDPFIRIANVIRNKLMSVIQATMNEPYASLMGGIVFGSQASPLPTDIQDRFRTAGLVHLLVASGTQVSILLSTLMSICAVTGLSPRARFVLISLANVIFAFIAGAGPSIVRAAIMGEAGLVAAMFERANGFYNSLALSALILLVNDPKVLFDVGFQLSFAATWALFYVAPAIEEKIALSIGPMLSKNVSLALAPTLATMPIVLFNFSQISFVSVISNFVIVPWIEIMVVFGFASTVIGVVFLPLAWALNNTLTLALALLDHMVTFFADLPFACRYFVAPNALIMLAYYIILVLVIERMKRNLPVKKIIAATIIVAVLFFSSAGLYGAGKLTVTFIDVGQGDSILIESASGQKILIDGGGKESVSGKASSIENNDDSIGRSIVVPFLRKKGINELNLVVLTHPHDDHVGGLVYVLDKIKVDEVMDSGQEYSSKDYKAFMTKVRDKKIAYVIARAGQVVDIGGGAKGYVLSPMEPFLSGTISDPNNNSVVIRLVNDKNSFLFTGDLGGDGEERVLSSGRELGSDVLKVGHHGSRTSTSPAFLKAVHPEYAVISVGAKNRYGHPSSATLDRLTGEGIKVFRTDLNGAIIFVSDGHKLTYSTSKL